MDYLYGKAEKKGGAINRGNVLVTSIQKNRREAKEKAIREIATLFSKNFGFKDIPTTGDIEKVIAGLRKHLPIEGKKNISNDSNTVKLACGKIAGRLNEIFGPNFIDTDVDTVVLCRDISDKLYSLTVSLNGEYFDTLANAAVIAKNLQIVADSLKSNFERIKKTTPRYSDVEAFHESALDVLEKISKNLNVMIESNKDTTILEELEKNGDIKEYFKEYTGKYGISLAKLFDSTYYTAMLMEKARKLAADVGLEVKKLKEIVNSENPAEALGKALNKNIKNLSGKKLTEYIESFNALRKILTQEVSREVLGKYEEKTGGNWKKEDNKEPLSIILSKHKKIHKETVVIFFDIFNSYLSAVNDEIIELMKDAEKGKLNNVDLKTISDALLGVPEITDYLWFYKMVGAYSDDSIVDDKDRELFLVSFRNLIQRLENINKSVKNSHLNSSIKYLYDIVDLIVQVSREHASSVKDAIRTGGVGFLKGVDTKIRALGDRASKFIGKAGEMVENAAKAVTGNAEIMGASEMLKYMKAKNPADILNKFSQLHKIILLSIKKNEILDNFKYAVERNSKMDFEEVKAKQIALVKDKFVELMEVNPEPEIVPVAAGASIYYGPGGRVNTSAGGMAAQPCYAVYTKKKKAILYIANVTENISSITATQIAVGMGGGHTALENSKIMCEKYIKYYQKYFEATIQILETAEALEIHFENFINKTLEIGGDFTNILMDFDTDILLKKSSGMAAPFVVMNDTLAGGTTAVALSGRGPLTADSPRTYFSPDFVPGSTNVTPDHIPDIPEYEKRFNKAWELCGVKNMISIFARFCGWKENNFMETTFKSPTDIANSILNFMMFRQFVCVDTRCDDPGAVGGHAGSAQTTEGYIGGGVSLEDYNAAVNSALGTDIGFNRTETRLVSTPDAKNYAFLVTANSDTTLYSNTKHLFPFLVPHTFANVVAQAGNAADLEIHAKYIEINRIFTAMLNSMVGKIVVAADTFNMLRGASLGSYGVKHIYSRMILGGAPDAGIKINHKLTEIYARVHLLLRFYVDINKENYIDYVGANPKVIWGLEMAGPFRSLYKSLITDIINTDYTRELVFVCNSLYEKHKGDKDPCLSVMRCVSEDFNEKIGFTVAVDFREKIKSKKIADSNISMLEDDKILRIPGEGLNRIAPSRNYTKNVIANEVENFGKYIETAYNSEMVNQIRALMAKVEKGLSDVIHDKTVNGLNALLLDEKIKKLGEDIEGAKEPLEVLTKYFQDPKTFVSSDFFRDTGDNDVMTQPLKVINDLVTGVFNIRQHLAQKNMFLDFYRNDYSNVDDFTKLNGVFNFYPTYAIGKYRAADEKDWANILSNSNLKYLLAPNKELLEEGKLNAYAVGDFLSKFKKLLSIMYEHYPKFIIMLREIYSNKNRGDSYQYLKRKYPENKTLIRRILGFEGNIPKELLGRGEGIFNNGRNTILGRPSKNAFIKLAPDQQKALFYNDTPSFADYILMDPEIDPVGCLYTLWSGNYGIAAKRDIKINNVAHFARILSRHLGIKEGEFPLYPLAADTLALNALAGVNGVGGAAAGNAALFTAHAVLGVNKMTLSTGGAAGPISVGGVNGPTNGLLSTHASYFLKNGIKHDTFTWFSSDAALDLQDDAMKGWWTGEAIDLPLYSNAGVGGGGFQSALAIGAERPATVIRYEAWKLLSKSLVGIAILYISAIYANIVVNKDGANPAHFCYAPAEKKHITDVTYYRGYLSEQAGNDRRKQPSTNGARKIILTFDATNFSAAGPGSHLDPIGMAAGSLLDNTAATTNFSKITWEKPTKVYHCALAAPEESSSPEINNLWNLIKQEARQIDGAAKYGFLANNELVLDQSTIAAGGANAQYLTRGGMGAGVIIRPIGGANASGLNSFIRNMLADSENRGRFLSYIVQLGTTVFKPMNMMELKEHIKNRYNIIISNKDLKINGEVPTDDIYGCIYGGFKLYKVGKDREEIFLPADGTLGFDKLLRSQIFQDYNIQYICQKSVQGFDSPLIYHTHFAVRMKFMERWINHAKAIKNIENTKQFLEEIKAEEENVKNQMLNYGGMAIDNGILLSHEVMSTNVLNAGIHALPAPLATAADLSFAFITLGTPGGGGGGGADNARGNGAANGAALAVNAAFDMSDIGGNNLLMRLIPMSKKVLPVVAAKVTLNGTAADNLELRTQFNVGGLNYFYGQHLSGLNQYPGDVRKKIDSIRAEIYGAFEQNLPEFTTIIAKSDDIAAGNGITAYDALRQFIIYCQHDTTTGVSAAIIKLASTDYNTAFPAKKIVDVYELIYSVVPKSLAELRVSGDKIGIHFGPFNRRWSVLLGAFNSADPNYINLQKVLAEHPEFKFVGNKADLYTAVLNTLPDDPTAAGTIFPDQLLGDSLVRYFNLFKLPDLRRQFTILCTQFIKKTSDNKTTITNNNAIAVTKYRTFYQKIIDPILSNDFIYNYNGVIYPYLDRTLYKTVKESAQKNTKDTKGGTRANVEDSYELLFDTVKIKIRSNIYRFAADFKDFHAKLNFFKSLIYEFEIPNVEDARDGIQRMMNQAVTFMRVIDEVILEINETPKAGELMKNYFANYEKLNGSQPFVPYGSILGFANKFLEDDQHSDMGYATRAYFKPDAKIASFATVKREIEALEKTKVVKYNLKPEQFLELTLDAYVDYYLRMRNMFYLTDGISGLVNKITNADHFIIAGTHRSANIADDLHKHYNVIAQWVVAGGASTGDCAASINKFILHENTTRYTEKNMLSVIQENNIKYAMQRYIDVTNAHPNPNRGNDYYLNLMEKNFVPINFMSLYRSAAFSSIMIFDTVFRFWVDSVPLTIVATGTQPLLAPYDLTGIPVAAADALPLHEGIVNRYNGYAVWMAGGFLERNLYSILAYSIASKTGYTHGIFGLPQFPNGDPGTYFVGSRTGDEPIKTAFRSGINFL